MGQQWNLGLKVILIFNLPMFTLAGSGLYASGLYKEHNSLQFQITFLRTLWNQVSFRSNAILNLKCWWLKNMTILE